MFFLPIPANVSRMFTLTVKFICSLQPCLSSVLKIDKNKLCVYKKAKSTELNLYLPLVGTLAECQGRGTVNRAATTQCWPLKRPEM